VLSSSIEWRLKIEIEENEKFKKLINQKDDHIKEIEQKSQMLMMEVGKKSQKILSVSTTIHILTSQIEKLKQDSEEERMNNLKEITELQRIISEKNKQIEKITNSDGEDDMEGSEPINVGDGMFDSIFGTASEELGQSHAGFLDSDLSMPRPRVASRSGVRSKRGSQTFKQPPLISETLMSTSAPKELLVMAPRPSSPEKSENNQKSLEASTAWITKLELNLEEQTRRAIESERQRSELNEMTAMYKRHCDEKERRIEELTQTIIRITSESSQIINEINYEYGQALQNLRVLRARI
jgi:hypothetical protein